MDLDPFVPIGITARHDALPRRLPAALPAHRQPARHAARRSPRSARNQHRVAARGREPGLRLERGGSEVELAEWGGEMLDECAPIAAALDAAHGGSAYREALAAAVAALRDPASLPSARVLREMQQRLTTAPTSRFALAQSLQHRSALLKRCRWPPKSQRASSTWRRNRSPSSGASKPPTPCRSRPTGSAISRRRSSRPRARQRSERTAVHAGPGLAAELTPKRHSARLAASADPAFVHPLRPRPESRAPAAATGSVAPLDRTAWRHPQGNRRGSAPEESPVHPHCPPGGADRALARYMPMSERSIRAS